MIDDVSVVEWVRELLELDQARFMAYFIQIVEKSWNDSHIKIKSFTQGDNIFLYDSKYQKNIHKLKKHWLGPFIVA